MSFPSPDHPHFCTELCTHICVYQISDYRYSLGSSTHILALRRSNTDSLLGFGDNVLVQSQMLIINTGLALNCDINSDHCQFTGSPVGLFVPVP
ncbi:hypothetical protein K435DRAFT_864555 [Dendrothele bispora CBS 962.96]|uniref:Uncharacterized protein n=1 Tax=Dendrothele bispora (strain CBS 962.96) TaxID=1314807 RepID=A0A4S8LM52_DENBC|nr:hypothetical protein K435DRAFT_864555 [Dendrothele bispora CBS 962.96]